MHDFFGKFADMNCLFAGMHADAYWLEGTTGF
jgi:hypothetical protein